MVIITALVLIVCCVYNRNKYTHVYLCFNIIATSNVLLLISTDLFRCSYYDVMRCVIVMHGAVVREQNSMS